MSDLLTPTWGPATATEKRVLDDIASKGVGRGDLLEVVIGDHDGSSHAIKARATHGDYSEPNGWETAPSQGRTHGDYREPNSGAPHAIKATATHGDYSKPNGWATSAI